jgi:hypothetical protein
MRSFVPDSQRRLPCCGRPVLIDFGEGATALRRCRAYRRRWLLRLVEAGDAWHLEAVPANGGRTA